MPTSVTPPPAEDEFECAQCGTYVHISLTRCPNCGVNLYEPEEDRYAPLSFETGLWEKFKRSLRRLFGEPHPTEALFEGALREKALYDDLLRKVGGDRAVVERLIAHEKDRRPDASRMTCLQNAIRRWERENQ
jgi:hypothetical protein